MKCLWEKSKNLSSLWGALVAEELIRLQVELVCISPGSRSTPLVAACAQRNELKKVVCQDERSAGFFALGYGRATGKPAAVIVTSGSAVANLFPAVVEASNDRVPLLLLTADRPPELRDVGANQTIDQVKLFGNYARWFADIPVPDPRISPKFLLSTVDCAHKKSLFPKKGPVHLNFMFREPFDQEHEDGFEKSSVSELQNWANHNEPFTQFISDEKKVSAKTLSTLTQIIEESKSGVIVVGQGGDNRTQEAIFEFAKKIGWAIFPDVLSALRFKPSEPICNFIDLALLDKKHETTSFDVVMQFGGHIVSKRLQHFLANSRAKSHVIIDEYSDRLDPSSNCSHHIETNVHETLSRLLQLVASAKANSKSNKWVNLSKTVEASLANYDDRKGFNEIALARSLIKEMNSKQFLFVGSSMPIRDLNMFADPANNPPNIFANRGASGIDGIISSACGVAKGLGISGVLFCGDLTFLHDVNGLDLLKSLEKPMQIVVVNNRGGGIFAMLDIYRQKNIFSPYFDAEHDVDISKIAGAFKVDYKRVADRLQWEEALLEIRSPKRHTIFEVLSDKHQNRLAHDELREIICDALESSHN